MKAATILQTACAVSVGWVACSTTPPPRGSRPSLLGGEAAQVMYATPAAWRYHPRSAAFLAVRRPLDGGEALYAGDRGERWLVDAKGQATAAAQLAPEDIVAVLRLAEGGILFVGRSGTGYESRDPLGPFVRSTAPLDPFVRVSAADSTVLAIRQDGRLVRSVDAGVSWQPVGPAETRCVDVALQEGGEGLALAVPEQLFRTTDGGKTWDQLAVQTVGAYALTWDKLAGLVVQGVLGPMRYQPGASRLAPLGRGVSRERHELPETPPRGPDATALRAGSAVFSGGEYLAVERDPKQLQAVRLWRGTPGAPLKSRVIRALGGCKAVRMAAFDRWITVACARSDDATAAQRWEIHRSEDRGKAFRKETFSFEAPAGELRLAMGADGALVVTGACPPQAAARGCKAQGILVRRLAPEDAGAPDAPEAQGPPDTGVGDRSAPRHELAPAAVPALHGVAEALAFSTDGRTAYAVGRRSKNQAYAVFVSRDGGASFEAREIEQLTADPGYESGYYDGSSEYYGGGAPRSQVRSLAAAEDGSLAIVMQRPSGSVLVVTDERGSVTTVAQPPGGAASIGAVGNRAVAVLVGARQVWESVDGGASWSSLGRLPLDPCAGGGQCDLEVICHLGGCVMGDTLSRIGWHGQSDEDHATLAPPVARARSLLDPKLRVPLSCTIDETPWKPLPRGTAGSPPTADQAAIGDVAWYLPLGDDTTAAGSVLHARGGKRARIDTVKLLDPVPRAAQFAYAVRMQIEGAVAVRYPVPDATGGEARLRNVEVVWENLLEGRLVRARIPDAGPYRPGDYVGGGEGAMFARPDLLSVGSGGVFVRIHQYEGGRQETLFLDGHRISSVPAVKWPEAAGADVMAEMARVDGVSVPWLLFGSGNSVVRARRDAGDWQFEAMTTGYQDPGAFGLVQTSTLAYVSGGTIGRHVMIYDEGGSRHSSLVYPLRADGPVLDPPVAVPMQVDTGDQPLACGTRQRANSPRVVVPFQPGTRHPVVVMDSEEPTRLLLTGQSVMYGTPGAPCIAAFDAEIVSVDGGGDLQGEQAILPLDDLERSWLFRTATEASGRTRIEYRLMSCRFDASAVVPTSVYDAPGARVRRR